MKINRNLTVIINRLMDQWIPPIIRDARWFNKITMRMFAGKHANVYFNFKDQAFTMSDDDYANAYRNTGNIINRETDLNNACLERLLTTDLGDNLLDAGCGRGFLANKLSSKTHVTGCDVALDEHLTTAHPDITFLEAKLEELPFSDNQFDTVICSHVLEHVLDPQKTISELRRVTKNQLIIIVPRERPYRQTFSLHVHFFPYDFSLLFMLGRRTGFTQCCELTGGDWFYIEKKDS